MKTDSIRILFKDRASEIDHYLDLLRLIDESVKPLGSDALPDVTSNQLKILYAHVYLHSYNLVEATMNWCLGAVAQAPQTSVRWKPHYLIPQLVREMVRGSIKDATNQDRVLDRMSELTQKVIDREPIKSIGLEIRQSTGSWDSVSIQKASERIGVQFHISEETRKRVHRARYLEQIKNRRNELAHGSLSFVEAGEDVTVSDLGEMVWWTQKYLDEVVECYLRFIDNHEFLIVERRPRRVRDANNPSH